MKLYMYLTRTGAVVFKKDLVSSNSYRQFIGMVRFPVYDAAGREISQSDIIENFRQAEMRLEA